MDAELRRLARRYSLEPTDENAHGVARYTARSSSEQKAPVLRLDRINGNSCQILTQDHAILFSYSTAVAFLVYSTGRYYRTDKKHSRTTSKHVSAWLAGQQAETVSQAEIDALVGGGER